MGILDSIVGWIAEQVMNILDLITGSVLGALGCDMSVFIRYFPAAETMYEICNGLSYEVQTAGHSILAIDAAGT